jgi:hypothetical protein
MREGCKSSRASEAWGSGAGDFRLGSAGAGKVVNLIGGARLAVTEGEGVVAGLRKLEVETVFGNYAKAVQAGMHRVRTRGGLRCGAGQHGRGRAGWAKF